jgi:hypothetical protein
MTGTPDYIAWQCPALIHPLDPYKHSELLFYVLFLAIQLRQTLSEDITEFSIYEF